jgi:hypothetical protein
VEEEVGEAALVLLVELWALPQLREEAVVEVLVEELKVVVFVGA